MNPALAPISRKLLAATAESVKSAAGLGRVVLGGGLAPCLAECLKEWPADISSPDAARVDAWVIAEQIGQLDELEAIAECCAKHEAERYIVILLFPQHLAMDLSLQGQDIRSHLEKALIERGLRKHPATFLVNNYEAMGSEVGELIAIFERVPEAALETYPIDELRRERDLHMDMLREPGIRSDAHVMRYEWASQFIRPGDRVLDAACGLGYGSYVMAHRSRAASLLGVDGSAWAIEYANLNFGSPRVDFLEGFLPDCLRTMPDASFDFIASFETLEHVEDPEALLAEFHRLLTPGGRIVVSVPNDWADETGKDPNPHHLHVYHWETLQQQLASHYLVESAWSQIASGCKTGSDRKWRPAPRRLRRVGFDDAPGTDAEWWLATAMRSPLDRVEAVPYTETVHQDFSGVRHLIDFGPHYANPWVVHSLVEIPYRLKNKDQLHELAIAVLEQSPPGAADTGAALAVLGYQLLGSAENWSPQSVADWMGECRRYLELPPGSNPHIARWHVSLKYLTGRMLVADRDLVGASAMFADCANSEAGELTPTLGTKVVDASFRRGVIEFSLGNIDAARRAWQKGITDAERCMHYDWVEFYGNLDRPFEFSMNDAVEIVDLAARCAAAVRALADHGESAGTHLASIERNSLRSALARMTEDLIALSGERSQIADVLQGVASDRDSIAEALSRTADLSEERRLYILELEARIRDLEVLSIDRMHQAEALDAALNETTSLSLSRLGEIEDLSRRLDAANELALGRMKEAEALATALLEAKRRGPLSQLEASARQFEDTSALTLNQMQDAQTRSAAQEDAQQPLVEHGEPHRGYVAELEHRIGELEALCLDRLHEAERLDSALKSVTALSLKRLSEVEQLSRQLEAASELALERMKEAQTLDAALGAVQKSSMDHGVVQKEHIADLESRIRELEDLSVERLRQVEDLDAALMRVTSLSLHRLEEIEAQASQLDAANQLALDRMKEAQALDAALGEAQRLCAEHLSEQVRAKQEDEQRIERMAQELHVFRAQLEGTLGELEDVKGSMSWRMVEPIRKVLVRMRGRGK